MDEMWKAIDIFLEKYQELHGDKLIDEMTEGSDEWFARVSASLLTTLSIMHKEGRYVS